MGDSHKRQFQKQGAIIDTSVEFRIQLGRTRGAYLSWWEGRPVAYFWIWTILALGLVVCLNLHPATYIQNSTAFSDPFVFPVYPREQGSALARMVAAAWCGPGTSGAGGAPHKPTCSEAGWKKM